MFIEHLEEPWMTMTEDFEIERAEIEDSNFVILWTIHT